MNKDEMACKIEEYVRGHRGVSFVELMRLFGDEAKGDIGIEISPNCFVWTGMSQEFADAVMDCWRRGAVVPFSVTILVYWADGCVLMLPMAKQWRKEGYKTPHWLPIVFNPPKKGVTADDY